MFVKVSGERIQETRETVYRENRTNLSNLKPLARLEVAQFIDDITTQSPTVQPETLSLTVQALINLEQTRNGASLLKKLSTFSEEDIGLHRRGGQAALPAANQPVPARILAAMSLGRDYSRAELLAATGISAADWTGAIRQLKEEGRVIQAGENSRMLPPAYG
jgi:hypothetical protein